MRRAAVGLCALLMMPSPLVSAQEATPPGEPAAEPPAEPPAAEPPAAEPPAAEPPKEGQPVKTPLEEVKPGQKWEDVFVVPRRPVLKRYRLEFIPTWNMSLNNSIIQHHGIGGMLNFYLSEALFIGLEGTYYVNAPISSTTSRYFLLGAEHRVLPSINRYVWSALLDFGYVPIHGKFTFFNSAIGHWEVFIAGGVGIMQTEVVPRDPQLASFTNFPLIVGLLPAFGVRTWLTRWLAIDAYLKNYLFADQLEPTDRTPTNKATAADAQKYAESQFTFDVVFGLGVSLLVPPGFEYKTLR